jgi:uncharacterized membrane protein (DUF485 family)
MWVPAVKGWARAFITASLIEAALLAAYISTREIGYSPRFIPQFLMWYHLFAIWFSYNVLLAWNPGARREPTPASNAVVWASMFAFQVLVTTPIIFGLLKWIRHARTKKESNASDQLA